MTRGIVVVSTDATPEGFQLGIETALAEAYRHHGKGDARFVLRWLTLAEAKGWGAWLDAPGDRVALLKELADFHMVDALRAYARGEPDALQRAGWAMHIASLSGRRAEQEGRQ